MKKLRLFLSNERSIGWIVAIGAALRLLFLFAGGSMYYGRPDYFIQGDTSAWFDAFINLLKHGTYTVNPAIEAGKFFRPPGYSFLFGFFYLLSFKNYVLAWKLLVAAQVIMDTASIYIISRIATSIVSSQPDEKKSAFANLSAALYAVYPFAILWAPVLYAETSSVFFLLLCIHYAFGKDTPRNALLSGLAGGIAILIRLQCAFGVLCIGGTYFFSAGKKAPTRLKHALLFCLAILISYGLWPARNMLHHRIVFSQDIHYGHHWSPDFISFLDFAHSISTDHTEYYFQILKDEKVNWPKDAYLEAGDSVLLDSAVNLCRTCGTGFANWKWGEKLTPILNEPHPNCDKTIETIFSSLTEKQKTRNTFHYWVTIPLQNLKKCFFKVALTANKGAAVKIVSSLLFLLRSALIFCGLFGLYLAYKSHFLEKKFLLFALCYFWLWYVYISFFHRNIEIRYLLHADIILLIPAAYVFFLLLFNRNPKANG